MLPRDSRGGKTMRLKLRYRLTVRPDENGEYPEALAKRLISAGLAEPDHDEPVAKRRRKAK